MLQAYLPPAATPEEIDAAVAEAIAETGATSPKDIGKVMKAVMPKLAGKNADGKAVNEAVRARLAPEPPLILAGAIGRVGRLATMTSRILGVVREQVVASFFGAGAAMDAYNVAFRIPNLLRDLFAEGAMSAAFVPTVHHIADDVGKESAWRLGNHVVNALIVVTGALVALGIVFMEPLS